MQSVSNFIYEGGWPVHSLVVSSPYQQRKARLLSIAHCAVGVPAEQKPEPTFSNCGHLNPDLEPTFSPCGYLNPDLEPTFSPCGHLNHGLSKDIQDANHYTIKGQIDGIVQQMLIVSLQ